MHPATCREVLMAIQTVAERVVDKVDEKIKADVMHWAAFYVRDDPSNVRFFWCTYCDCDL